MVFRVMMKDTAGKVLSGREGAPQDLEAMAAEVTREVMRFIHARVLNGLPPEIFPPLTVEWGEFDA